MPALTGANLLGPRDSRAGAVSFHAQDPATGRTLEPPFAETTSAEVDAAARVAEAAFEAFAALVEEGSWVDARIDRALPDRKPAPRPDLRRMLVPLGPVAVFGASNFPLAFSVAGGDTVSALAAGCPVAVKAHPAHPGTSELVARAVLAAAAATGMPGGVFSMVHGASPAVGQALVAHPAVQAVGFTGSFRAGRALLDAAAHRPQPIPVFAEMGSANPLFVLPDALATRGEAIATALAASVTLGCGQFCTNPGLTFVAPSPAAEAFVARRLSGHLTATVHATEADLADFPELLPLLARKAGRVVLNGVPTGVEVTHAMHHGGPWPATTDSRATSIGTAAILRFARPVSFQDAPSAHPL